MKIDLLEEKIKDKDDSYFNLKKFGIDDLKIDECVVTKCSEDDKIHYRISPKKNKREKKYIYQCQVCNRFFLGGKDSDGEYIGNCYSKFEEERENFWKSELSICSTIEKKGKKTYGIKDLLKEIDDGRINRQNTAGVWALWIDYGSDSERCIQVAKNKNIYSEIYADFCKGEGSIDYSQYKDNGTIVIISDEESDFKIEAQYAHDFHAEKWDMKWDEPKMIGEYKKLRTIKLSANDKGTEKH